MISISEDSFFSNLKEYCMKNKIVVVGSSNTDMIIQVPKIPRPKETILGGRFSMAAGGKGANQAVAAARAGGDVHFICRVGSDLFGQKAIDGFIEDNIHVEYIRKDDAVSSGVALIFVSDDGENSIAVAPEANSRLSIEDVQKAKDVFTSDAIVITQLEIPIETVRATIEMAQAAQARMILNPAPAQKLDTDIIKHVSILTPNEIEAEILTDVRTDSQDGIRKAGAKLISMGVETVLITCGADGVYFTTAHSEGMIPAFRVDAIDTTAAGDVFNGALAVALANKMDLDGAILFANAAAALSVTQLGAQPSAPTRHEIEKFMALHVNNSL